MRIYIVVQTVERDDIRSFEVILTTLDKEKALKQMRTLVTEDPFGDFKNNGIEFQSETYTSSNFIDGFTAFEVIESEVV